jgi:hypothetical protein
MGGSGLSFVVVLMYPIGQELVVTFMIPIAQCVAVSAYLDDTLPLTVTITDRSDVVLTLVKFRYKRFDFFVVFHYIIER